MNNSTIFFLVIASVKMILLRIYNLLRTSKRHFFFSLHDQHNFFEFFLLLKYDIFLENFSISKLFLRTSRDHWHYSKFLKNIL